MHTHKQQHVVLYTSPFKCDRKELAVPETYNVHAFTRKLGNKRTFTKKLEIKRTFMRKLKEVRD